MDGMADVVLLDRTEYLGWQNPLICADRLRLGGFCVDSSASDVG